MADRRERRPRYRFQPVDGAYRLVGAHVEAHAAPVGIDDDPVVRESLSRMLSRVFVVETATGVSDARRVVSSAHFDAILCDVMMDEGGGEAFHSWLQREHPHSADRVIFVNGGVTDEVSRRFLDGQEQPVLYQPVDLLTVKRAVDEVSVRAAV